MASAKSENVNSTQSDTETEDEIENIDPNEFRESLETPVECAQQQYPPQKEKHVFQKITFF